MWPFSKSKAYTGKQWMDGAIDFHSHILPGVDDGIEDMEQSLEVLRAYGQWGVKEVWLTPHVMEDYPNTTADLRQKFSELNAAYAAECGADALPLHLSAEYMLDSLFAERLANNDLLPYIDERHILVETSCIHPPYMFDELLKRIKQKGYFVVLAHPERYIYMKPSDYQELRSQGVLMQLDITSIMGAFGEGARRAGIALLKKGYYDFAGSDLHSLHSFERCMDKSIDKSTYQLLQPLKN